MRHLSAKIRITLWFAVMMLIIDALVLTFISVINVNVVTRDPEAVLVEELNRNVDRLGESDALRLDAVDYQQRGVYSILYAADGSVMRILADRCLMLPPAVPSPRPKPSGST